MCIRDRDSVVQKVDFIFCAVDMKKDEIRALEERYARAECPVVSNNSAHRGTPDCLLYTSLVAAATATQPFDGTGSLIEIKHKMKEIKILRRSGTVDHDFSETLVFPFKLGKIFLSQRIRHCGIGNDWLDRYLIKPKPT